MAFRDPNGATYIFWTNGTFTLTNGATSNAGTWVWGSAGGPNALANVYDGAFKMWNNALSLSNRMNAYFTGLEVRAFDNVCPTSCANGGQNRITLDTNAAYMPQARILHEMGHIASYKASRDQSYRFGGDYCWPNTNQSGCGWSLTSAEWSAANFEEGMATFLGDAALYAQNAVAPHTCITSAAACATNSFNIETSSGSSCTSNGNRWALSVDRYLWDAYDSRIDYATDTLSRNYYEFIDTIHAFDNGNANRQKDEPWCSWPNQNSRCDFDGRSAVDFRENWIVWGQNTTSQWTNNCGPAGD